MLTSDSSLRDFECWLQRKDFRQESIRAYVSRLRRWLSCTSPQLLRESISSVATARRLVAEHVAVLVAENASAATLRCFVSSARCFYGFYGIVLGRIRHSRVPQESIERRVLSDGEIRRLMEVCRERPRDRAMIALMLHGGFGLSHICRLNISDLTLNVKGQLALPLCDERDGKMVALSGDVISDLLLWVLAVRPRFVSTDETALFVSVTGGRITAGGVDYRLRHLGFRVGLQVSARVLKNTYIQRHLCPPHAPQLQLPDMSARTNSSLTIES